MTEVRSAPVAARTHPEAAFLRPGHDAPSQEALALADAFEAVERAGLGSMSPAEAIDHLAAQLRDAHVELGTHLARSLDYDTRAVLAAGALGPADQKDGANWLSNDVRAVLIGALSEHILHNETDWVRGVLREINDDLTDHGLLTKCLGMNYMLYIEYGLAARAEAAGKDPDRLRREVLGALVSPQALEVIYEAANNKHSVGLIGELAQFLEDFDEDFPAKDQGMAGLKQIAETVDLRKGKHADAQEAEVPGPDVSEKGG